MAVEGLASVHYACLHTECSVSTTVGWHTRRGACLRSCLRMCYQGHAEETTTASIYSNV